MAGDNKDGVKPETFLDKFQHPFVSSFISSWIVCNWDIFYALIGGVSDPFKTIDKIKDQYSFWGNFGHLIVLPLVGTAVYIFAGPWLLNWFLLYKHKLEVKRKFDEQVANGNMPMTRTEYQQLTETRIRDARENEVLRAQKNALQGKIVKVPGRGDTDVTKIVEELFAIQDDLKRAQEEALEYKSKLFLREIPIEPKPNQITGSGK